MRFPQMWREKSEGRFRELGGQPGSPEHSEKWGVLGGKICCRSLRWGCKLSEF